MSIGYENDRCHFCHKKNAGHARAEDSKPGGPYFDACESCAKKQYPEQGTGTDAPLTRN
jgi:hypothetical protein